jgi:hypothetical protein
LTGALTGAPQFLHLRIAPASRRLKGGGIVVVVKLHLLIRGQRAGRPGSGERSGTAATASHTGRHRATPKAPAPIRRLQLDVSCFVFRSATR